ncbi:hypothetical protein D3F97_23855 [Escherichia coli]|nr:hypothetical protein [Escherichia coli]EEW2474141.1 hypothetical protein [Escherichia coli]EEW2518161.1 hypothetical protein [Escherichia coli]EEW2565267.1 hypothetical protein [Escherichia coli]EEX2881308.1 hypothetical protein [Escherichia coli]
MSYKKWTDLISVTMKKAAHYADNLPDGPVRQGRSPGKYPVNRSFPGKPGVQFPLYFSYLHEIMFISYLRVYRNTPARMSRY